MKTYDWIVVGAGITGAALSYELAQQGFSTLLLEQHDRPQGATRFSYGGLAFWAATNDLTRQLYAEGLEIHQQLSAELEADTQFREMDLLLTIAAHNDPAALAANYAQFEIPPQLLSVDQACELEPLLDRSAISGALTVRHGHIEAELATQGYCQAFQRLGGDLKIARVTGLVQSDQRVSGVTTEKTQFHGANVVICAGGISRHLLKAAGIHVQQFFTHAELIETPPVDVQLRTLVMPAEGERFKLEATSTQPTIAALWNEPGHEPTPPILDAGAIQFLNGQIRIGQVSRTLTDPCASIDPTQSESDLRAKISTVLPALGNLPGTWHHCLIAFSSDRLPLIGAIPHTEGIHVFSGFSNPLVVVPAVARRYAHFVNGKVDRAIEQLSPSRFGSP
ncbi:MAG: FAD-binding oxidoreductase [Leptolyngbyaceae cyanobacterium CSU_1_3]|nr:FAD-binding oxidoreductase [Leptolyngbyaceae cyanobacterium CSU_1_3]